MISQKVKSFACPDLSNLTKNLKTTNISETLDIPSKNSKEHLYKVLTFIGLIGVGYLMCLKSTGPDLSSLQKFSNPLETIHTTYFLKWSHDDQQAMTLVG